MQERAGGSLLQKLKRVSDVRSKHIAARGDLSLHVSPLTLSGAPSLLGSVTHNPSESFPLVGLSTFQSLLEEPCIHILRCVLPVLYVSSRNTDRPTSEIPNHAWAFLLGTQGLNK